MFAGEKGLLCVRVDRRASLPSCMRHSTYPQGGGICPNRTCLITSEGQSHTLPVTSEATAARRAEASFPNLGSLLMCFVCVVGV